MKKIITKIKNLDNKIFSSLIENFENITFFEKDRFWVIEIYIESLRIKKTLENEILRKLIFESVEEIKEKNWILENRKEDKGIETENFFFSQGLLEKKKKKKYSLTIPASSSFGTDFIGVPVKATRLCINEDDKISTNDTL